MAESKSSILIVDDEANMRHMLTAILRRYGYRISDAGDGEEGLRQLQVEPFTFVLCDVRMPGMDGLAFLEKAHQLHPETTVIMMSAYGTIEDAVQAMRLGAYDYIAKPFKEDEILLVLKKAEERNMLLVENRALKKRIKAVGEGGFASMIGKSAAMEEVFAMARKVADYDTTILITGESGTGKELVARGIHTGGRRRQEAFVAVNCGSIPESLLESEFFGYVKGAFTGADRDKPGLFEAADSGTLFLDEVGELPLAMQVKLLRVLQEQEVRRVGSPKSFKVNVRVIAATARNLDDMVREKQFREDLYYRLNVVNILLPPLRQRADDIHLLSTHFMKRLCVRLEKEPMDISPKAMELLMKHSWPGNVRELENTLERAIILAEKSIILPENLPTDFGGVTQQRRIDDYIGTYSLKKAKVIVEERMISRAMEASGGNKSKAAKLLELSYPALLSKLKAYGVN